MNVAAKISGPQDELRLGWQVGLDSTSRVDKDGTMKTEWPCGHPRTQENTQRIGKAGLRCRQCRRRIAREWHRNKTGFYTRNDVLPDPPVNLLARRSAEKEG